MRKNIAGQIIGAQMLGTDGSPFTGQVTVYITGDNGTQTIGSVGSGICTHKGRGLHNYTPSQSETNYDFIQFTFVGTNAISQTIEIYNNWDLTDSAETNLTLRQAIRLMAAVLAGDAVVVGNSIKFRNALADTKNRVEGTVDSQGNRTFQNVDAS